MKIGDRVYNDYYGKGKIINIDKEDILVEFDEPNDELHDGNGFGNVSGKPNHCLWLASFEFEILPPNKDSIQHFLNLRES